MPVVKLECRSIRKVEVPGLGDFYFKQIREFDSNSDFSNLQRFVDSGAIRIIAGSITTSQQEVEVSYPTTQEPAKKEEPKPEPPKVKNPPKPRPKKEKPQVLTIESPVAPQQVVQEPTQEPLPEPKLEQILSDLSDKLASEVVKKVSSGLSFEGTGVIKKQEAFKMPTGDIYIPSIKVTDMTSNLALDSRVVGTGGKVNESLGKLKALRGNKNG